MRLDHISHTPMREGSLVEFQPHALARTCPLFPGATNYVFFGVDWNINGTVLTSHFMASFNAEPSSSSGLHSDSLCPIRLG